MNPLQLVRIALCSIAGPALTAQGSLSEILVPIHAQPDDPGGSRGGIWAADPDYKVRFHANGIEYFPVLGSAYPRNLPLRWQTASIRIGDRELASIKATAVRASDYRYEYRSHHVVEAYDVRVDGVEQTFRIDLDKTSLPVGDLVVRGDASTQLTGQRTQHRHGGLSFCDSNRREVLRYGAAVAIDAEGRRFAMTTSFDGEGIELRLGAADIAAATFPLLVDPLIGNDSNREAGTTAVASVFNPSGHRAIVNVYTRITSSNDHDVFAVMSDVDLNLTALIWAELGTFSSVQVAAGAMHRSGHFVIAAERRGLAMSDVVIYSHSQTLPGFGLGRSRTLPTAFGEYYRNPEIGGSRLVDDALVVVDYSAPSQSGRILGFRYNPINNGLTQLAEDISPPVPGAGVRHPEVTPYGPEWVVSWISDNTAPSDILARKVFGDGSLSAGTQVIQPATNNVYDGVKIAGEQGRYVATYSQTPRGIGVRAVRARRFDWTGSIPNSLTLKTLSSGGSGYQNGDIAFDWRTASHWIATFQRDIGLFGRVIEAARLGDAGGLIDVRDIHGTATDLPFSPAIAVTWALPANEFPIVYATSGTPSNSVLGEVYEYPPECFAHNTYGSSCGTLSESATPTIAGSSEFSLALQTGSGFVGLAACFISPLQSTLPLDSIGLTGCNLLVEPALGVAVPATFLQDQARVTLSLGGVSPFIGFFNSQWVYSSGATPLGLATNPGMSHESR